MKKLPMLRKIDQFDIALFWSKQGIKINTYLNMEKTELLNLIGIEKITFADKTTGEKVTKYKYSFLNAENKLVVGFHDELKYQSALVKKTNGSFDAKTAVEIVWKGRVWNDAIQWRLA